MPQCVYESKANRRLHRGDGNAPRYGYVLSQPSRVNGHRPRFAEVRRAWEKAQVLAARYRIRHLLLAEPWETALTAERARELNAGPWGGELQKKKNGSGRTKERYFATGAAMWDKGRSRNYSIPLLTLQPIQIVPEGSTMFACPKRKLNDMIKEQALTAEKLEKSLARRHADVRDFEARLRFDFNATVVMMTAANGPGSCLFVDFQVMVDPVAGGIYHLDFDRCSLWKGSEEWQFTKKYRRECLTNLESYKDNLLGLRTTRQGPRPVTALEDERRKSRRRKKKD